MPSTYAHYRFGKEVKALLSSEAVSIVNSCPELYSIGLHGPDIFFYYGALYKNPVNTLGSSLHRMSGRKVIGSMLASAGESAGVSAGASAGDAALKNRASLSYLYGFLCHFALDSVCHGYINKISDEYSDKGLSHAAIESAFDRLLMEKDGLEPTSFVQTGHIVPSLTNACVISSFFPETSPEIVQRSLKGMLLYHELLRAPGKVKRTVILTGLKAIGKYDSMSGLLIPLSDLPLFKKSNETVLALYEQAVPIAVKLIEGFAKGDSPSADLSASLSAQEYDSNFESEVPF